MTPTELGSVDPIKGTSTFLERPPHAATCSIKCQWHLSPLLMCVPPCAGCELSLFSAGAPVCVPHHTWAKFVKLSEEPGAAMVSGACGLSSRTEKWDRTPERYDSQWSDTWPDPKHKMF